jgi:hypothetical protein
MFLYRNKANEMFKLSLKSLVLNNVSINNLKNIFLMKSGLLTTSITTISCNFLLKML